MAEVQLSGVCKRFGPIEALRGIDLTIPDRTYLCLLGPSGCGKTTLLRCVAGLETVDAGEIRIGSRRIDALEPFARNVGWRFRTMRFIRTSTLKEIWLSRCGRLGIRPSSTTRRSSSVSVRWPRCSRSKRFSTSRSPR